jgi:trk system potassium uptake protein TrkA
MNLKLLGVSTIWVKAINRIHHRILTKLGADRVVLPEQEIGQHIAQMLHNQLVRDYLSLGNGYYVVDFRVPEQLNARIIEELKLADRFEIRCLGAMRGGDFLSCEIGETELRTDDKLLLLGRRQNLRSFGDSL